MLKPVTLLLAFLAVSSPGFAQMTTGSSVAPAPAGLPSKPAVSSRLSSHETANARIEGDAILIVYGRPHIKDPKSGAERTVWGGQLVPSDQIWRTGADEATLLITQKPLVFENTTVPAGVYSLFTYYAADGSAKLVVNKKIGQWGIGAGSYEAGQDLVQVPMKKSSLDTSVEQFTMSVEKNPSGGQINLLWGNLEYSASFTVAK